MKNYIIGNKPEEPLIYKEKYIWFHDNAYFLWDGYTGIEVTSQTGRIEPSALPEDVVYDADIVALEEIPIIKANLPKVFHIYLNLMDANLRPGIPVGGRYNPSTEQLDGDIISEISDGTTRIGSKKKQGVEGAFCGYSIGTFTSGGSIIGRGSDPIPIVIGRDGTDGTGGTPGRDGKDGTDGVDGVNMEFIFTLLTNKDALNRLHTPYSNPNKTGYVPTIENGGSVDVDGYDHPQGISSYFQIEAMCYRKCDLDTGKGGNGSTPTIGSIGGESGKDGDGVEYIFRLATLDVDTGDGECYYDNGTGTYHLRKEYGPPTNQEEYNRLTPEEQTAGDKYDSSRYPRNGVDDPQSVSHDRPIQFVSVRKYKYDGEDKKGGFFSEPTCGNKVPLMDANVTAFTAFAFAITNKDISDIKPVGGTADDPDPDDIIIDGERITGYDSIPTDMVGYLWMTSSVGADGQITGDGGSYPKKVNDAPDFQAEYSNDYPGYDDPRPKLPNFGAEGIAEDETAGRNAAEAAGCGIGKDCYSDDPDDYIEDPSFMATCQKKYGAGSDWVVTKIKGENGLNPVTLHILNDSISVTVDENNRTWMATANRISIEMQRDVENFRIDPAKVEFFNQAGGEIPAGITFSDQESRENQRGYDITINIAAGMTLLQALPLGVRIQSDDYDASAIINIVPVYSSDARDGRLVCESNDINRTYTSNGTCLYEPDPLYCSGLLTVGLNAPIEYGKFVYSTSISGGGAKYKIGDIYTRKEGVLDYDPETGIVIHELSNHESLQSIFVYMIAEDINMIVDREKVEINTCGRYELSTNVNQIKVVNENTLSPDTIEVDVGYSIPENNIRSLVTNHVLYYYFNGDIENINVCTNRNNNPIDIANLSGFSFDDLSSISFILKTNDGENLTNPITISFIKDGRDGISITNTINFFKAGKQTPAEMAPPSSATIDQIIGGYGGSQTQVDLSDSNPVLGQFIRVEYSDSSARHLAAFPSRYYNQQTNITYDQIDTLINEELNTTLEEVIDRLEGVEATDAKINAYPDKGLIELLTQYANSDGSKTFADFTADAAEGTIETIVGSTLNDTTTAAGQKIDGIESSVTTFASQLYGVAKVQGAVQQLSTDAITSAVTKSHYVGKANSQETTPQYKPYSSDSDTGVTGYHKELVSDEMSGIKIESNKISLLTGSDGNFKAGIQIIADAANTEAIINPVTGQSVPAGSVILLSANNVIMDGNLFAGYLQANAATITNIVAGSVTANELVTGNPLTGTMGTIIKDGQFNVYYQNKKRVELGVSNGDIVLTFFDTNENALYNLGPSGFRDRNGNLVYEGTF